MAFLGFTAGILLTPVCLQPSSTFSEKSTVLVLRRFLAEKEFQSKVRRRHPSVLLTLFFRVQPFTSDP
jgi:hypothetical protein